MIDIGVDNLKFSPDRTDFDKISWTISPSAYFATLYNTQTSNNNVAGLLTMTLVFIFRIPQTYAIASCISAHFCDVACALQIIKFGRKKNGIFRQATETNAR